MKDKTAVREMFNVVRGVLITGGRDISPERYGDSPHPATNRVAPEREEFDFLLLEEIKRLDVPTLAICYGIQALNVAFGGTLYQDITDEIPSAENHRLDSNKRHRVRVEAGSLLHRILGVEELMTNSSHHQAIKTTKEPIRRVALSEDGIVEAIESTEHRFILGVQWHPERMTDEELHLRLFKALVEEARK